MITRLRSFGGTLALLVAITTGTAILVASVAIVGTDRLALRSAVSERIATQAEMLAIHSVAAISFSDAEAGAETLEALRGDPTIISARIFDRNDEVFASYVTRGQVARLPSTPPPYGFEWNDGTVMLSRAIIHGGERLGTLVVLCSLETDLAALWRRAGIVLGAGAVALLVASLLAVRLMRLLTRPLARLVVTARRISRTRDYSLRSEESPVDELADLTRAFNHMLEQIQVRDTERATVEEQLSRANLELAGKNQEMEQFVYTASHDLKSPLVTMQGFIGHIVRDVEQGRTDRVPAFAARIADAATRMRNNIDDLLELSRIGRVMHEPQWVEIPDVVQPVIADHLGELQDRSVSVEVEADTPPVYCDPDRMVQVLENLISNAVKYACDGPMPTVTIGGHQRPDETRLFVRDNGPGIHPDHHDRVFRLFERLHTAEDGTGIGLAIVKRIMVVHEGRVWIESSPGDGATFWLAFPRPQQSTAAA